MFAYTDKDLDLLSYDMPQDMKKMINGMIPGISVRKSKIRVFSAQYRRQFDDEPLMLIDGIPFFNIDSLLKIDPVRFKRVQVLATINNLAPYGNLGSSGIIAFYTADGYKIMDSYATKIRLRGYRNNGHQFKELRPVRTRRVPYLASNYLYKIHSVDAGKDLVNLTIDVPDFRTELNISVLVLSDNEQRRITKKVYVDK